MLTDRQQRPGMRFSSGEDMCVETDSERGVLTISFRAERGTDVGEVLQQTTPR